MLRPSLRRWLTIIGVFIAGIIVGGYIFSDTQARSFLAVGHCDGTCLKTSDVLGLIGSVGIQKDLVPNVVLETDKTVVIRHPFPESNTHLVIIPKRDIKNVGALSALDEPYLVDAYGVMQNLIQKYHLRKYKVYTYGPGLQEVTYLHFHLTSNE